MELEGSLLCSQEPDESSSQLHMLSKIHSHINLLSIPRFSEWFLPFRFLNFITLIIFDKAYKL